MAGLFLPKIKEDEDNYFHSAIHTSFFFLCFLGSDRVISFTGKSFIESFD